MGRSMEASLEEVALAQDPKEREGDHKAGVQERQRGQCPWQRGQDQDLAGPDPPSLEQFWGQHHSPPGWRPACRKTPQGVPRPPGR